MPQQVRRAVLLLWLSFVITTIDVAMSLHPEWDGMVLAISIVTSAAWAFVIVALSRRHNWARIVALVVIVASLVLYIVWTEAWPDHWWEAITMVVTFLLEGVALYWLFTGEGAAWYRRQVPGSIGD